LHGDEEKRGKGEEKREENKRLENNYGARK
jgi:hypothetical protein